MTTPTQIRAIEHSSKTRRTDLRRRYNQNLLRGGMAADKDTKIVPVVRSAATVAATKEWCKKDDRYHNTPGGWPSKSPEERLAELTGHDPERDITQSIYRPLRRQKWLEEENFWPVHMQPISLYRHYGYKKGYTLENADNNARLDSIGKYVEFKWEDNVEKFVVLGYTHHKRRNTPRHWDSTKVIILVSERRALSLFDVKDGNLYRKSHQFDARAWGMEEYRIRRVEDVYIPNFKRLSQHRDIIVTKSSIQRTLVQFIKRCSRKSRWRNPAGHR